MCVSADSVVFVCVAVCVCVSIRSGADRMSMYVCRSTRSAFVVVWARKTSVHQ